MDNNLNNEEVVNPIDNNGDVNSNPNDIINGNDMNANEIDPTSIFGVDSSDIGNDNIIFDEQTNLNKSINNHTDVVGNYNQNNTTNIDDSEGISSYEEQISNGKDIEVYTQQPKQQNNMPDPQIDDNNMYYDNNGYNDFNINGFNNNNYDNNGYDNYNNGYNNGYVDNYGNGGYDNYNNGYNDGYADNYNNGGYDNYNTGYDNYNNGYNDGYVDNYNNGGYDNYNNGYDNYNNGYNDGYVDNYGNGGYDNYNNGYSAYNTGAYSDNSYNNNEFANPVAPTYGNQKNSSVSFNGNVLPNTNKEELFSDGSKHPKTIGPVEFEKKVKNSVRPFNFMLTGIYLIIIAVIGYFGYNLWLDKNSFTFSKDRMNLVLGYTYEEKVYVKGELDNNSNYEWQSEDTEIATVNSKGKITAKKEGTVNIIATSKKTKKKNTIIVKVINADIKQFTIKPNEKVVYIGNTYTVVPLINGQSSLTINYEWASSNTSVATVDENGVVTPVKSGNTTISVTIPGTKHKATISIIVSEKK